MACLRTGPFQLASANYMKLPAPMLAKERKDPFSDADWTFEAKLDGIRVIAIIDGERTRLFSRNNIEISHRFPLVTKSLASSKLTNTVIDGEVVAFDKEGKPSFDRMLQRYGISDPRLIAHADKTNPVEFHVFDVLFLDGKDVRGKPLKERRTLLEKLKIFKGPVKLMDSFPKDGELLFQQSLKLGLEGIMAKRLDSTYQSGLRTGDWLKIKALHTEEFVIGGYTGGSGARASTFGALLLGKWEGEKLHYVGTSGGGFTGKLLDEILKLLKPIAIKENPFGDRITADGPHHFVKPIYWAEVSFTAWTTAGRIRLPRFQRLRLDLTGIDPKRKAGENVKAVRSSTPPPRGHAKTNHKEHQGHKASQSLDSTYLAQLLEEAGDNAVLRVDGQEIKFNELNSVLWPKTPHSKAITKRDLILYLVSVSEWLLPHLKDRPLTWVRFSKGIEGPREVHKHWKYRIPDFVPRTFIWSTASKKATEYILVSNLATLLWLAQIETLEFHPWYSRVVREPDAKKMGTDFSTSERSLIESVLNYPDFLVFDLDPYIYSGKERPGSEPELNVKAQDATKEAAFKLKELLDEAGINSYAKSSGKTGLHIYVPIVRNLPYETTRAIAESFGKQMVKRYPKLITMEWSVAERTGCVFFDHLQNTRGKTLIGLYSPRAVAGGRVAWPIAWKDLANFSPLDYNMKTAAQRLRRKGDAWADILENKQDLRAIIGKRLNVFLA